MSLDETLQALSDPSKPLSRAALKELSGLEKADVALFWQKWQTLSLDRRVAVARTFDELAEDNVDLDFQAVLLALLDDSDPHVRVQAIDGLWENDSLQLMQRLIAFLNDESGEVRAIAALSLSRFAYRAEVGELTPAEAQMLCRALLDAIVDVEQPLEVRRRAIEAVGYFAQSSEAQTEIGRAYAHPEQMMRESAVAAMGRSMRPTWFPYIERELRSISPAMRYEAARAVGELGEEGRPLLSGLLPLVDDEDNEIATATIWALGQVGGSSAKRVLERVARSKDPDRRQAADEALEELSLSELGEISMPLHFSSLDQLTTAYDHIYLSPHLDDAALSCGGAIARHAANRQHVLVITICTAAPDTNVPFSPFAAAMHADWGLSPDRVVAQRLQEDVAALEFSVPIAINSPCSTLSTVCRPITTAARRYSVPRR
ncbi:HEAT repeat domain-containing protein [Candidatus Gracilibacteria bacterium]|nr:HEAT repeat domain-containing protein [Candidatus Gracilibacteria bacterium]